MHIIIGFLGSVITILWLLHRLAEMGIDLGGLNPWAWRRRRKWRTYHDANPVFKIDSPMDATALLITAIAKADGAMSSVEKQEILSIFQDEFKLSQRDAVALLTSSNHLLGKGEEVRTKMKDVLRPSLDKFTAEQIESARELFQRIATVDGDMTEAQRELIHNASTHLAPRTLPADKWSSGPA